MTNKTLRRKADIDPKIRERLKTRLVRFILEHEAPTVRAASKALHCSMRMIMAVVDDATGLERVAIFPPSETHKAANQSEHTLRFVG